MAREINAELLDTKIEKAQQDLVKAKHRYDAAAATLKDLAVLFQFKYPVVLRLFHVPYLLPFFLNV